MNKTQIFATYADFLARTDKKVNGVLPAFAKKYPNFEQDNATNKGCWNCLHCENCSDCVSCTSLDGLSDLSNYHWEDVREIGFLYCNSI